MEFDPDLAWRPVKGDGFNAHIGPIRFAELGPGHYAAALDLEARHLNVGGVCHGGVLLSLADTAMGTASYVAAGGRPCATISFDAQFIAAAKHGQTMLADVHQLRAVRDLSFVDCALWAGGRQVMRASGIWKYLEGGIRPAARSG